MGRYIIRRTLWVILLLFITNPQLHLIDYLLSPAINDIAQVLCRSCFA